MSMQSTNRPGQSDSEKASEESQASIVEFYRIHRFASVLIVRGSDLVLTYKVLEPSLSHEEEKLIKEAKRVFLEDINYNPLELQELANKGDIIDATREIYRKLSEVAPKTILLDLIDDAVKEYIDHTQRTQEREGDRSRGRFAIRKPSALTASLGAEELRRIRSFILLKTAYFLARDFAGYAMLDPLIRDPNIEDISGEADVHVYVYHKKYGWLRTSIYLDRNNAEKLVKLLALRSRRDINAANPIAEGSLVPEGYRAHLALHVVTRRGSTFTIRKYAEEPFTLPRLVALGTLSPRIAGYFWLAVDFITSMLIAGPMGSGKTTLLNTIAMLLPPEFKIVTLEDTPEIFLPHENWVPLVTRPSFESGVRDIGLFDLLKSSLRQRPEYLVIGEIRGEEAATFFQAIAVGHGGLATIHGESIHHVVRRLRSPPLNVAPELIPLVKVIVLNRNFNLPEGLARRVAEVVEVSGVNLERGTVTLNRLATYDPATGRWEVSGKSVLLETISERTGMPISQLRIEWDRRSTIMEYLALSKKYTMKEVIEYVRKYRVDPDSVYGEAETYVRGRRGAR